MKTLLKLSLFTATVIFSSQVMASSLPIGSFKFDCTEKKMPSQQEFGVLMGFDNFSENYSERSRLRVNLLRKCHVQKRDVLIVQLRHANTYKVAIK